MKEWWNVTEEDQKAIMAATTWNAADNGYFRGGGFSSRFETKAQMPATMIRLNLVKGLGPVLQIAEGWTVGLPQTYPIHSGKRTDYTWPCTWFTPRCDGKEGAFKDAYSVMNNWGANHGAISYGHIGADLITMCSMLRNSGLHAQRSGREDLPSGCMERIRNGQRGRRLPRMQELRTSLQIRTTVVVKYAMIETVFRLCRRPFFI